MTALPVALSHCRMVDNDLIHSLNKYFSFGTSSEFLYWEFALLFFSAELFLLTWESKLVTSKSEVKQDNLELFVLCGVSSSLVVFWFCSS